ncbi:MAG: hypothetical protein ABEJ65_02735 [bacterium]
MDEQSIGGFDSMDKGDYESLRREAFFQLSPLERLKLCEQRSLNRWERRKQAGTDSRPDSLRIYVSDDYETFTRVE